MPTSWARSATLSVRRRRPGTSAADFATSWAAPVRFSGYNKGQAERVQIYVQDMYDALP